VARRNRRPSVVSLALETLLILVLFNASSYFGTTTYAKSIYQVGLALTTLLSVWIFISSRYRFGYGTDDLGLMVRPLSKRQWIAIISVAFLLYAAAFIAEIIFPTEVRGEVTFLRLIPTALFTLTFGPVFEELLFRGYLYKLSEDAFGAKAGSVVSASSLFTGLAFGFWHLPTPLILLYFNDPIVTVYGSLLGFVLVASMMGTIVGEIRRRTGSIVPGAFLHFCANSTYVIVLAGRLLL